MIKFISDYQAEIAVTGLFILAIFAVLIFSGVIGGRPKNVKYSDSKRKPFGSNLDAYEKIDSDF